MLIGYIVESLLPFLGNNTNIDAHSEQGPGLWPQQNKTHCHCNQTLLLYIDHYLRLGWSFSLCDFLTFPQPLPLVNSYTSLSSWLKRHFLREDVQDTRCHPGWISSSCPTVWSLNCSFPDHTPTPMNWHLVWPFCGWWVHSLDLRLHCPVPAAALVPPAWCPRIKIVDGQTSEQMGDWQALCQNVLHVVIAESWPLYGCLSPNPRNLCMLLYTAKGTFQMGSS